MFQLLVDYFSNSMKAKNWLLGMSCLQKTIYINFDLYVFIYF